jgi:uncharacterized protein YndB with AHSA1/START domain
MRRGGTKLKILGGLVLLIALAMGGMMAYGAATSVRQLRQAGELTPNGRTEKTRAAHALDYSVAIYIAAPPSTVWRILTDASAFPSWNSTVIKLGGNISPGSQIQLMSKDAPDRTFNLKVSAFDAPKRMVWEDGNPAFMGIRTFTLTEAAGGTQFAMSETLSGAMLPMIEGSLPDFTHSFDTFAADLKHRAETTAAAP